MNRQRFLIYLSGSGWAEKGFLKTDTWVECTADGGKFPRVLRDVRGLGPIKHELYLKKSTYWGAQAIPIGGVPLPPEFSRSSVVDWSSVVLSGDALRFDNGAVIYSDHDTECCEAHYLDFSDLVLKDFKGLVFDLTKPFFNRIPEYGIELLPLNGHSVKVPGYGHNNGYYSDQLDIVVAREGIIYARYDITECQHINQW